MDESPRQVRVLPGAFFALLTLLCLPLACDEDPSASEDGPDCSSSSQCAAGQFCNENGDCEKQCTDCGDECEDSSSCPTGQFCDTTLGSCQQECTPGETDGCGSRQKCSEDGMCVADDDFDFNIGGAGGIGGDDDDSCIEVQVDFTPEIPSVVLLIDQSGSMMEEGFEDEVDAAEAAGTYTRWDCGDSSPDSPTAPRSATLGWDDDVEPDYDWRWNVVRNVLLHPENGIVKPLEDKVRFGLATYSSIEGNVGGTCPMLTEVGVDFDNHEKMLDAFQCSDLVQDTPTRESLTAVAEKLAAQDFDGPKVIVLATDGDPDTCACGNWDTQQGRDAECALSTKYEYEGRTYNAADYEKLLVALEAQRIYEELGIGIEVINLGAPSLKAHLDDIAAHGGAISGKSIEGTSPGALVDAFSTIVDGVRSCVIDLDGSIAQGRESTGKVQLDMDPSDAVDFEEIELDDPDGWVVNSPTQIELVGTSCETIKSGDHELDITFPCEAFVAR